MPKVCEICKKSFPDNDNTCPHCGAKAVAEDERLIADDALIASDSGEFPMDGPEGQEAIIGEEVTDLGDDSFLEAPDQDQEIPAPLLEDEPTTFTEQGSPLPGGESADVEEGGPTEVPRVPAEGDEEVIVADLGHEEGDSAIELGGDEAVVIEGESAEGYPPIVEESDPSSVVVVDDGVPVDDQGSDAVLIGEEAVVEEQGLGSDSAVLVGEDAVVEEEDNVPVATDSGILIEEDLIAADAGAAVAHGGDSPSNHDRIAEEVESGVDLIDDEEPTDQPTHKGTQLARPQMPAPTQLAQQGPPAHTQLAESDELEESLTADSEQVPEGQEQTPVVAQGEAELTHQKGAPPTDEAVELGEDAVSEEEQPVGVPVESLADDDELSEMHTLDDEEAVDLGGDSVVAEGRISPEDLAEAGLQPAPQLDESQEGSGEDFNLDSLDPLVEDEQGEEGSTLQDTGDIDLDSYAAEEMATGDDQADLLDEEHHEEHSTYADDEPAGLSPDVEAQDEEADVKPTRPTKKGFGVLALVMAIFLGLIGGAGAMAGLMQFVPVQYRAMLGMDSTPKKPISPTPGRTTPVTPPAKPTQTPKQLRETGNFQAMLETLPKGANVDNPEQLAQRGEARWRSFLQANYKPGQPLDLNASDELKQAKADLEKAAGGNSPNADAIFSLGNLYVRAGQIQKAREQFQKGKEQFPKQRRFQAALDRLDIMAPPPGTGVSHRHIGPNNLNRAQMLALLVVAFQAPAAPGGPAGAPAAIEEAGYDFWAALKLARTGNFSEAQNKLKNARQLHDMRRFRRLGKQQNPESDPDEAIFLRAADELLAYWALQDQLLQGAQKLNLANKNDPTKAVEELLQKGQSHSLAVAKLQTEKVIADPKDFLTGINMLVANNKTFQTAATKLTTAKVIADAKDLPTGVDKLVAVANKLTDAKVIADPAEVEKGVTTLVDDHKVLQGEITKLTTAKVIADPKDFPAGIDKLASTAKKLTTEKVIDNPANVDKGVDKLLMDRKKLEDSLQVLVKLLNDAKIPTASPADLPKRLEQTIKLAKMKDPMGKLREQQAKINELTKEVMTVKAKAKEDLRLVKAKADEELRKARAKADEELRMAKAMADKRIAALNAKLKGRLTPKEMLGVWLPVVDQLRNRKDLSTMAAADAKKILDDPDAPATLKGKAYLIQGLALRNADKFAEAKDALEKARKALATEPMWLAYVEPALDEVEKPAQAYLTRANNLLQEGKTGEALGVLNAGVEVLPAGKRPALQAHRALLSLAMARAKGPLKATTPGVAGIRADAQAAVKAGLAEGHYASGRLAEELGQVEDAIQEYNSAIRIHGNKEDAAHFRYIAALARVLTSRDGGGGAGGPARLGSLLRKPENLRALLTLTLVGVVPGGLPEEKSADRQKAEAYADQIIRAYRAGKKVPFEVYAEALRVKGLYTEALREYAKGLSEQLPPDKANGLMRMIRSHPSLRRPDSLAVPDPIEAQRHFSAGLSHYFDHEYSKAEKAFGQAVYHDGQDARYFYFLGLSKLLQGQRGAYEDFKEGARLEQEGKPTSAAVARSLERVQGRIRRVLNEVRERPR